MTSKSLHCLNDGDRDPHAGGGYSYVNLQSQWYSRRQSLEFVVRHERQTGKPFDVVILTRLDLCPCQRVPLAYELFTLSQGKVVRVGLMAAGQSATDLLEEMALWSRARVADPHVEPLWPKPRGTPRADDSIVIGTGAALLAVAERMVASMWNVTVAFATCDPHLHLGLGLLLTLPTARMDVRTQDRMYLFLNRVLIRNEMQDCAVTALRRQPEKCFELYCPWRPVVGYFAGVDLRRKPDWMHVTVNRSTLCRLGLKVTDLQPHKSVSRRAVVLEDVPGCAGEDLAKACRPRKTR